MATLPNAVRILVINPNTSQHMTDGLRPAIESLGYQDVKFTYFTSPSPGIQSINSPADATESADVCLPALIPLLPSHDAFLVACYSQHPLVSQLKLEVEKLPISSPNDDGNTRKYVTGIFEASAAASLSLVGGSDKEGFGIVSTGKIWEEALQSAVEEFLGAQTPTKFLGCETTGLNASELHDLPSEVVKEKMMEATKRLLGKGKREGVKVRAICLGCAGMVGLDEAVRQACLEELGDTEGSLVSIVDGVKAGVGLLASLVKGGF